MKINPVMDQSQILGPHAMSHAGRSLRFFGPNSGFDSRDRGPSLTVPCPICNGDGEIQIFAHDGTQTEYTVRCPHCAGFGRVGREP